MDSIRVLTQNVARSQLGDERRGGSIASLRIQVHFERPIFIILTEISESQNFTGKNTFKGYELSQYGWTGERTGGVAVFSKKGTEIVEGTLYTDLNGHFSVQAYNICGNKIVLGAIYGPSVASDRQSHESFEHFLNEIAELSHRIGTRNIIIAGDFNAKLDQIRPSKPRTVRIIKIFMNQHALIDLGLEYGGEATWRRPHLPQAASRLDYILISSTFNVRKFTVTWTRFDHGMLISDISFAPIINKNIVLKDWSLASPLFLEAAPDIVRDVLLDHDATFRNVSHEGRMLYVNDRGVAHYESELQVSEPSEGVTNAHILILVVKKLVNLQKKVQNKLKHKRKKYMENLSRQLGNLYGKIDFLHPQSIAYNECQEKICEIKGKIKMDSEKIESADRMRISHFYESSSGKNTAASFFLCKESKKGGGIKKLITENNETVTDPQGILQLLENGYKKHVGTKFVATM